MVNSLRPLWLMFYAPARGMSEARDRAQLIPALLLAFLAQLGFALYTQWPYLVALFTKRMTIIIPAVLVQSAGSLITTALIFVPCTIFIANLFERRGSLRLAIQQEYPSVAATVFYALAAANIAAMPLAWAAKASGWLAAVSVWYSGYVSALQHERPDLAGLIDPKILNPDLISAALSQVLTLPFLAAFTVIGVRQAFRFSWLRSIVVVLGGAGVMLVAAALFSSVFGAIIASPLLLLLIFFLGRSYVVEATRAHRARTSFKQNLEAATLNPADASAHYNLGLIHQQRKEFDEARARFQRAIDIDEDEIDAHYQLGRIARVQDRLAEAIKHFEPVVARAPQHAQHEVWREIGATYLAAGQFEDAREALDRFLASRQSDPEGLYLMGRAHAGLGHKREATDSMQACIEAVKTAPAYKYRTEKRWLNKAQEFIKSQ
jgi:tetratricopeptide (TPR) repeat protein